MALTDRALLINIGNIIGGPTMTYSPENEIHEWRERAENISRMIQEQLRKPEQIKA
jgi:hypothetical protein